MRVTNTRLRPIGVALAMATGVAAHSQTLPAPPVSPAPVTKYEYDAEGNPTKTVVAPDSRALTTQHGYDALSRRTNTTDAKNGVTQLGYDLQDQLTSVTDPRQLMTQYQPTGLGDVKQLVSPDTGTTNSTFDAAGNLKTRIDARGVLGTYSYDPLNRLTQVVYSKAGSTNRTLTWTYDQTGANFGFGIGRLTTTATPAGSTTFRYDSAGRVTTTTRYEGGLPLAVNYSYDAAGRLVGITYPSGRIVNIGWANDQRKSISVTATNGTTTPLLDQVVMSPLGLVQSWMWKIGAAPQLHERIYDTSGRPVRYPLGALVRDITYDDADRISRYTHYTAATALPAPAYDQTFSYDALDRLINVTAATNWSYAYDANGNRTASSTGIDTRGYGVSNTSNRLDTLTNPSRSMSYDTAGNTLSDTQSGSAANYTAVYSLEGRLASMAQGTSHADFAYDGMGRRILRTLVTAAATQTTRYVYDLENHLIAEYPSNGDDIEYVWLGDTPVGAIKKKSAPAGSIEMFAIHADHLNTPRVASDAQGAIRWRWMGEPFGASLAEEQPTSGLAALQVNLRFPGQQYEAFGGRFYNFFRDYDPTTGRYVQSDPLGLAGGINTYAYVNSRPTMRTDSMGLLDAPPLDPNGPPDSIPKPPDWPVPMGPNGSRCELPEHNALQAKVDLVCSTRRGCNQNQSCPELQENLSRARACYEARRQINNQCFNGGDLTHRVEQEKALASVNNCLYWLNRRQCFVNCDPQK